MHFALQHDDEMKQGHLQMSNLGPTMNSHIFHQLNQIFLLFTRYGLTSGGLICKIG